MQSDLPPSQPPDSLSPPGYWQDVRPHLLLVGILILALAMRLPSIPIQGHGDLIYFNAPWTRTIQEHGLLQVYAFQDDINYPPLYLVFLGLIAAVLPISRVSFFIYFDPQLLIMLKLIPVISEMILIGLVYYWLPRKSRWRWIIPVVMALYPGLIATSAFWGQIDLLLTVLLTASIIALNRQRPTWSWVFFGLALLTKFQAITLLPLVACLSLRRYGWRRFGIGLAVGAAVVNIGLLPFIAVSGEENALRPYTEGIDRYPRTTLNAFNLWFVVNPDNWDIQPGTPELFDLVDDDLLLFGQISYKTVGLVMLGAYVMLIMAVMWRKPKARREFVWAAALGYGFFMLPTQIHERYLYPAAVFALIGVAQDRRLWPVAAGMAFTYSYNVIAAASRSFNWLGVDFISTFGNIALLVAMVNIGLLAWMTWIVIRPKEDGLSTV